IESSKQHSCLRLSLALSEAAIANADASQAKVLWLLADACDMRLDPTSTNEPFRSNQLNNFAKSNVDLLADISEEVDDHRLRARLADLAWFLKEPRDTNLALRAIDSYLSVPLDAQTWLQDGRECWERAINLARSIGVAAGDRVQKIETEIVKAFSEASED